VGELAYRRTEEPEEPLRAVLGLPESLVRVLAVRPAVRRVQEPVLRVLMHQRTAMLPGSGCSRSGRSERPDEPRHSVWRSF
jgi:hypothetical protein